ncbi:ectin-like isoform X1 [Mytilus californianus]|uniref:ectin-like isoform X1 n=1 Tax=Mytilus californianus TaxID=6549 RepID=UPI0022480674|nr:ectin-like isoform X1 [Mytilus californianus]
MRRNQFICCLMINFKEWASNQTNLVYQGTCTGLNTTIDIRNFNMTGCIIPGWSLWFNSSCSVTCGDGVIVKTRTCDNPPPSDDGLKCVGSRTETSLCNLGKCPESCRHSNKGSNNKSVDNLDNKSGKKLHKLKAMNQKRRDKFDWKK